MSEKPRATRTLRVHTPIDLGLAVREARQKRGLDQRELAAKVGVSRQWIIALEKGRPGAGLGLVLQTLDHLGLRLAVDTGEPLTPSPDPGRPGVDIDEIIRKSRGEPS